MLFLSPLHLAEMVATDTHFAGAKDVNGWTCMQVAVLWLGISLHPPMWCAKGIQQPSSLARFAREEGVPAVIHMDNAQSQWCGWLSMLRKWLTSAEFSEPGQQNQNPAELHAVKWTKGSTSILLK